MFSGMRKPILAFVFRKTYFKVSIHANIKKNTGYRCETATNIVLANTFFSFDYAWLAPLQ